MKSDRLLLIAATVLCIAGCGGSPAKEMHKPNTPLSTVLKYYSNPSAHAVSANVGIREIFLSTRAESCLEAFDSSAGAVGADNYRSCGLEGEEYFVSPLPPEDMTFTQQKADATTADILVQGHGQAQDYSLVLQNGLWKIDAIRATARTEKL